jgi:DNA-binding MarR family transcriptional regulator
MGKTMKGRGSAAVAKGIDPISPWICQIARLSIRFMGGEMERLGFGPGQFHFLAALYQEEGISQDELSQRVGVNKSNTSRALLKLEKYGLIRRASSPENHRVKIVYLEQKARDIENEFRKIQCCWNNFLLEGVSEETKTNLLATLKEISANAEAYFNEQENVLWN